MTSGVKKMTLNQGAINELTTKLLTTKQCRAGFSKQNENGLFASLDF